MVSKAGLVFLVLFDLKYNIAWSLSNFGEITDTQFISESGFISDIAEN